MSKYMMVKSPIIRKVAGRREWHDMSVQCKLQAEDIVIEKVINLSDEEFEELNNDFFEYRSFITENIESMFYDSKTKAWHCIAIVCDREAHAILIESEGYDYARYTGFILKEEIVEKPTIKYDRKGSTGNIYSILAMCQSSFRQLRRYTDYNNMRDQVMASKSYEEALNHVSQYFVLNDMSSS